MDVQSLTSAEIVDLVNALIQNGRLRFNITVGMRSVDMWDNQRPVTTFDIKVDGATIRHQEVAG